jgi:hypothetical protein
MFSETGLHLGQQRYNKKQATETQNRLRMRIRKGRGIWRVRDSQGHQERISDIGQEAHKPGQWCGGHPEHLSPKSTDFTPK